MAFPAAGHAVQASWQPRKGMSKSEVIGHFSKNKERTYRVQGAEEWMTFDEASGGKTRLITFRLQHDRIVEWKWDDREEVVREYMGEFCSEALQASPKISSAIRDVLRRIPEEASLLVTRRDFPALFTEYYTEGASRLANSSGIYALADDPPTFARGTWIVKLNSDLERLAAEDAIRAIVAHELAHRVLGHRPGEKDAAEAEKAANRLIRDWGFQKDYLAAKRVTALLKN